LKFHRGDYKLLNHYARLILFKFYYKITSFFKKRSLYQHFTKADKHNFEAKSQAAGRRSINMLQAREQRI